MTQSQRTEEYYSKHQKEFFRNLAKKEQAARGHQEVFLDVEGGEQGEIL